MGIGMRMGMRFVKNKLGFTLIEVLAAVGIISIVLMTITQVTLFGVRLAQQTGSNLNDQVDRSLMIFVMNKYLPFATDLISETNIANMQACCPGTDGMGRAISGFRSNNFFERNEAYPLLIFNRYGPTAAGTGAMLKATGLYFIPPNPQRAGILIIAESTDGQLDYTKSVMRFENIVEVNIPTLMTTRDAMGLNKVLSVPIEIITRRTLSAGTGQKLQWCPQALANRCTFNTAARFKDEQNDIYLNILNNNLGLSNNLTGDQVFRTTFRDPLNPIPQTADLWFRQRIPARKYGSTFYFPLRKPGAAPAAPNPTIITRTEP